MNIFRTAVRRLAVFALMTGALYGGEVLAVAPQISSITTADTDGDGQIDRLNITFDRSVTITDPNGASDGFPAFSVSGGYTLANKNYSNTLGTTTMALDLVESGSADTDATPTVTYTQATNAEIEQLLLPFDEMAEGHNATATDSASPVLLTVEGEVGSTTLTVTFSEPVYTTTGESGALVAADFTLNSDSRTVSSVSYNAGAENGTLTMSSALDSSGDLGVDTLAAASSAIYDGSDNAAGTSSVTINDTTAPTIVNATLFDVDGNGNIDEIVVQFSEPVKDSSIANGNASQWTFGGTATTAIDSTTATGGSTTANSLDPDTADDKYITLFTNDSTVTGTSTAAVAFTSSANTFEDFGNNDLASDSAITEVDSAGPVPTAISTMDDNGNGKVDMYKIVWSESVDDATFDSSKDSATVFILSGSLVTGASVTSETDTADDATIYVGITEAGSGNTDAVGDYTAASGGLIDDRASTPNEAAAFGSGAVSETDGAKPVLMTVTGEKGSATLTVTFSEPVYNATGTPASPGGDLAASDFTLTDSDNSRTISSASYTAGAESGTITLSSALDDSNDLGTDTLAAASSAIYDGVDLAAGTAAATINDTTAPTITSATLFDVDGDGNIDEIVVQFSEPIKDSSISNSNASQWTFGGTALTGVDNVTDSAGGSAASNSTDPGTANDEYITLFTDDSTVTGTSTAAVTFTSSSNTFEDFGGNDLATTSTITEVDSAKPVPTAISTLDDDGDGIVDMYKIVWSETVDDSTFDNTRDSDTVFTLSGSLASPAADTVDDNTIYVSITEAGSVDSDSVGDYTATAGLIDDFASTPNEATAIVTGTVSETDGAKPVLLTVTGEVGSTTLTVTFSEPAYANSNGTGDLAAADFTFTDSDNSRTISSASYSAGAESGTVTLSSALDSSSDLGVDTLAAASSAVYDASGNAAGTSSVTINDTSAPTIVNATLFDVDGDGNIDEIVVQFSEPVKDSSISNSNASQWTFGGTALTGVDNVTDSAGGSAASNSTDPGTANDEYITLFTDDSTVTGTSTAAVAFTASANTFEDFGNNDLASDSAITEVDSAKPVPTAVSTMDDDGDGKVDTYKITWSESVDDSTFDNTKDSDTVFTLSGSLVTGGSVTSETDTVDDATIYVGITEAGSANSDAVGDYTATAGLIDDFASTPNEAAVIVTGTVTESDGAKPVLLSATGESGSATLTVTFSEPVYTNSNGTGDLAAADFSLTDSDNSRTISSVSYSAGAESGTLTLSSALDTSNDVGTDTLAAASSAVYDASGNAAGTTTVTITDTTVPTITNATLFDVDGDGNIDEIVIQFSEAVKDSSISNSNASQWTFGGTALTGVDNVTDSTNGSAASNSTDPGTANDEYITLFTDDSTVTGTSTAAVAFTASANTFEDLSGNDLATTSTITEVDSAKPVPTAISTMDDDADGIVDMYKIVWSESVDDSTFDNSKDSDSTLTLSGSLTTPSSESDTADDATIYVGITEAGSANSDAVGDYTATAGLIDDFASTPNEAAAIVTGTVSESDGAKPILLTVEGEVGSTTLTVTFSEPAYANSNGTGDLAAADFTLTDSDNSRTISSVSYSAGAESGTLTLSSAPDSSSDVGTDTLAAASSAVYDASGNAAATTAVTINDTSTPTIVNATLFDVDGDGNIDEIAVQFSEPVKDSSIADSNASQWTFGGTALTGVDNVTDSTNGSAVSNSTDPGTANDEYITLFTDDSTVTGTSTAAVAFTSSSNTFEDFGGNDLASDSAIGEVDSAKPVPTAISTMDDDADGIVDMYKIVWSESVDDSTFDNTKDSDSTFTLSGSLATPSSETDTADDSTIYVGITEAGSANSDAVGDYTATAGLIDDFASTPNEAAAIVTGTVTESDGAKPVLLTVTGEKGSATLTATFSEPVYANSNGTGDLAAADFTLADSDDSRTISSVSVSAGAESGTVTLSSALDGSSDVGTDTLAAASNAVYDASGNAAATTAVTINDVTAPTVTNATLFDVDGDGNIDEIVVQFSEPVKDSSIANGNASQWTFGGTALTGVDNVTDSANGSAVSNSTDPGTADDQYITLFTDDSTVTGTSTAAVAFTSSLNTFEDFGGNDLATTSTITEVDAAKPVPTAISTMDDDGDGKVDMYKITWSESVDDSTFDNTKDSDTVFTLSGSLATPSSETDTADDATIYVGITEAGSANSDAVGDYTATAGLIDDFASTPNEAAAIVTGTVSENDGAKPVLLTVTGEKGSAALTLTFSEPVYNAAGTPASPGGDLAAADFTLTDSDDSRTISSVSHTAGAESGTVTLSSALDSSNDIGNDTLAAASSAVYDGSGNTAGTTAVTITDSTPLTVVDATLFDVDGDGNIDEIVMQFSEPVKDSSIANSNASQWTFGGTALTGVDNVTDSTNGSAASNSTDPGTANDEYITLFTDDSTVTGTSTAAVAFTSSANTFEDFGGNDLATTSTITEVDSAKPVPTAISTMDDDADGIVDMYKIVWSESVDDSTFDNTKDSDSVFTLSGSLATPSSETDTADDSTIYVGITEAGSANSDAVGDYTATAGLIDDFASTPNEAAAIVTGTVTESDGAKPILMSVTGEKGSATLTVTFSEPVYANSNGTGDLAAADFTLTDSDDSRTISSASVSAGAESGTVTLSSTLDGSNDVGTDTLATASSAVYDGVGNAAATTAVTINDTTVPTITSATLFDVDGDGNIDEIVVQFSEPVNDSSISDSNASQWTFGGTALTGVDNVTDSVSGSAASNSTDPGTANDEYVTLFTDDSTVTGTSTAAVAFTSSSDTFEDFGGNDLATTSTITEVDAAKPVPTAISTMDDDADGIVDMYKMVWSESVDDSTFDNTKDSDSTFTLSGSLASPSSETDTADDATIYVGITEAGSANSDAVGDYTATAGLIDDFASTPNEAAAIVTGTVTESDGAKPVLLTVTGEKGSATLTVTFSEPAYANNDASGALAAADFTLTDTDDSRTVSSVSFSAGAENGTLTLSSALDGSSDIGTDTLAAASGAVYDASGNAAATTAVTINDTTAPTITDATLFDVDGDGNIDEIVVRFSEPIKDSSISNSNASQWTFGGTALTGVDNVTDSTNGSAASNSTDPGTADDQYITLFTDDSTVTGTGTAAVAFTSSSNTFEDFGGNDLASDSSISEVDAAKPVPTAVSTMDDDADGIVDMYKITWSESVDDSTFDNTKDSDSTFTLSGSLATPSSETDTADDATIYVGITEAGSANSDAVGDYTATAGLIDDLASPPNEAAAVITGTVSETDGAKPVLLTVRGDSGSATLTVTFSEPVYANSNGTGDLAAADFTLTDSDDGRTISSVSVTAGAESGTLTLSSVLDGSNDVGTDTLAAASGAVYDASANTAATTAVTIADSSVPTVVSATLFDVDGDGNVDEIVVRFSESMDDGSISNSDASQWTFGGTALTGVDKITDSANGTTAANGTDPGAANDEYITLFTNDSTVAGTGLNTLAFTSSSNTFEDISGNDLATTSSITEVDKARPVPTAISTLDDDGDGIVDMYKITWSESVDDSTFDNTKDSDTVFTLSGSLVTGGSVTSESDTADDAVIYVGITEAGSANSDSVGDYTATAGLIDDFASTPNEAAAIVTATVSETDGAKPVPLSITTMDDDGDGKVDMYKIVWSEPVDDSTFDNTKDSDDTFTLSGSLATPASESDTADDATIYVGITEAASANTGSVGDYTASAALIDDRAASPNSAATIVSGTVTESDGAAPVIVSVQGFDDDGNGFLDRIVVTFSEALSSGQEDIGDWTIVDADKSTNLLSGLTDSALAISGSTLTFTLADNTGTTGTPYYRYENDGDGNFLQDGSGKSVATATNNSAPTAGAGSDQTVDPGTVTLDGTGSSDPEGFSLTYSWTQSSGTSVTLSSSSAAQPTFRATADGTYVFSLTVNDSFRTSTADTVTITVNNVAPHADAGPDFTSGVGSSITLDGKHSGDPNGTSDISTYAWSQVSGATSVTIVDADSSDPQANFSTSGITTGTYVFRLTVTDDDGATDTDDVTVIVQNTMGNRVPAAHAGFLQVVNTGETVTLDGTGSSDPDGDSLTYSWSQTGGTSVTLSSSTAVRPTFTPSSGGVRTFNLTVNDGTVDSRTDTVRVVVLGSIPVADAGADQSGSLYSTVTLDGTASLGASTYSWSQTDGPAVTLSSATASQPTFTPRLVGTYIFSLTVNNGTSDSPPDSVTVTVNDSSGNEVPTADAGSDQTVSTGSAATLSGSGTDADGDSLSFFWTQIRGPWVVLSDRTVASPTFTPPVAGVYEFELRTGDGSVLSKPDAVRIIANASGGNSVPAANAGADVSGAVNTNVLIDGTGSSDANGDSLAYVWSQSGGLWEALSNRDTAQPALNAANTGTYTFTLYVRDGSVWSTGDSVTATLTAASSGSTTNTAADSRSNGTVTCWIESGKGGSAPWLIPIGLILVFFLLESKRRRLQ